ncbi:MAG: hypothetical protein LBK61_03175 [Spirochaetaceae bacterium]|nr:hypothetical protein [Spirochaetaceae bacterium]
MWRMFAPVVCLTRRRTGSGGGSVADPAMDAKGRPRTGKRPEIAVRRRICCASHAFLLLHFCKP